MSEDFFKGRPTFHVRAILLGERLRLKNLEAGDALALTPLAMRAGDGIAVLLRYGVVVLFGVDAAGEAAFRESIAPLVKNPYAEPLVEELDVQIDPARPGEIKGSTVYIVAGTMDRLQVIADVVGKSLALTLYESTIARRFEQIEPVAAGLMHSGKVDGSSKELVRHIGGALLSEYVIAGRMAITEKPEVLWDNPALEGLFLRLEDEFEITERHTILERKLTLISRSAGTLVDLLHSRYSVRLEWAVIILIAFELLISVVEFVRH